MAARPACARALAVVASVLAPPALADASLSGRDIMEAVAARHERPHESSTAEMTLVDGNGRETRRRLKGFARREADGGYRYMLTFTEPAGIAGVAMLAWDHPESGTDQWLFLPAAGAPKRVIGSARRGYFLDTDFALEDFLLERRDRHRYDRLADGDERGVPCFVVDVVPSDEAVRAATGYARKRVHVDRSSYLVRKVDYHERGTGQLLKTMLLTEQAEPAPGVLRPKAYRMINHKERHETAVAVETWNFSEAGVPAEMFLPRYLAARRHMR